MRLCRMLHEENGMFSMSEVKVREIVRRSFERQGGILAVVGEPSKIEGMILMILSTFWYSDDWHLEELFSYVHPEHRKSGNASALIDYAKLCSDEIGIPLIIGALSHARTVAKVRLYRKALGEPIGAFFAHNLQVKNIEASDPWKKIRTRGGKGARARHNRERHERWKSTHEGTGI